MSFSQIFARGICPRVLPPGVFLFRRRGSDSRAFSRASWPYYRVTTVDRFFHDPSCIQQLSFGQFWADQLQTGERNAESVGGRNGHGQGWIAREIYRDRVLQLKDMRVEDTDAEVEQRKQRWCFLQSGQCD